MKPGHKDSFFQSQEFNVWSLERTFLKVMCHYFLFFLLEVLIFILEVRHSLLDFWETCKHCGSVVWEFNRSGLYSLESRNQNTFANVLFSFYFLNVKVSLVMLVAQKWHTLPLKPPALKFIFNIITCRVHRWLHYKCVCQTKWLSLYPIDDA